jgi:site-specific DNA recombinase
MKKAAIYARVSTKIQKEEGTSLESQVEACYKLAIERGLEVPPELVFKEDWPGTTMDRPLLNQVRNLVKVKDINVLLVYSTDRLARNPIHLAIIAEECEKRGGELIFVTEPLDASPEGQLIRYVRGYAAEIEREKIAERTLRGKRARALQGKLVTGEGSGLFGYRRVNGVRHIDESGARVVRMIYKWLVEDRLSERGITKRLMEINIPSPQGRIQWAKSTVHRILTNSAYCGETYAFKLKKIEPEHTGSKSRRRYEKTKVIGCPKGEWIALPHASPPIISRGLFEAAQRQLKQNYETLPRNKKYDYLLQGLVFCHRCGRKYYGMPEHKIRVYRHKRELGMPGCQNKRYQANILEEQVWKKVQDILLNPELLFNELERRQQDNSYDVLLDDLSIVLKRLDNLHNQEGRLIRLYISGEIDDEWWRKEKVRIESERKRLIEERGKITTRIEATKKLQLNRESLKQYCEMAAQNLKNFDFQEERLALEALQIKVWIDGEKVTIEGAVPLVEAKLPTS